MEIQTGVDAQFADPVEQLRQLQQLHTEADQRLRELVRRTWLSPTEQVELTDIKKRKLRLKDRMRELTVES